MLKLPLLDEGFRLLVGFRPQLSPWWGVITTYDPFLYALKASGACWVAGWRSLTSLYGVSPTPSTDRTITVLGYSPQNSPYSSSVDAWCYGSSFSNLFAFTRILQGQSIDTFDPRGEHNVHHGNVAGTLIPRTLPQYEQLTAFSWPSGVVNPGGWELAYYLNNKPYGWGNKPVYLHHFLGVPGKTYGSLSPNTSITAQSTPSSVRTYSTGGSHTSVQEAVRWLEYAVRIGYADFKLDGALEDRWFHYHDVSFEESYDSYEAAWYVDLRILYNGIDTTQSYKFTLQFSYSDLSHSRFPIPGEILGAPLCQNVSGKVTVTAVSDVPRAGWYPQFPASNGESRSENLSFSATQLSNWTNVEGTSLSEDSVIQRLRAGVNRLGEFWNCYSGDLRAATYVTTGDALAQVNDGFDQNMIENIAQLTSTLQSLPDLRALMETLSSLRRGHIIATVGHLIDFLSSVRLTEAFAWAPTIDLIINGLSEAEGAMNDLIATFDRESFAGRGALRFDFPDELTFPAHVSLNVHTKVVVPGALSPFARQVLGIDALGLSPSLSNFWDLVPYSFAVDWIANIGRRLDAFEAMTLLAFVGPRVFVHSFLLRMPLDDSVLDFLGLSGFTAAPNEPGEIRLFVREVSRYLPGARSSRFDFGAARPISDWLTPLSFLWQFAK